MIGECSTKLQEMQTARCNGTSTGGYPPVPVPVVCGAPFNVDIVENNAFIQNGTQNNYTQLKDQVFWLMTNYSPGNGYQNLTAYDGCTGALLKDFNVFTATGRYLSGLGMEIDPAGILWCQVLTAGVVSEPLWLNFNTATDACTLIIPKDGTYRIDDSRVVNDLANNAVWIEKSSTLIKRDVTSGAETTTIACTTSDWPELDTANYRMWIFNINSALSDTEVYDASTGALLTTITTTTPDDAFWAFYNVTRSEMVVNYYHASGTLVEIYDTDTYALKLSKNTSDYGADEAGRILGYISSTDEYVMMLENTSASTTQLVFLNATTLAINDAYDTGVLSGNPLTTLMLALKTDNLSAYTVVAEPGYINNKLIRVVRP